MGPGSSYRLKSSIVYVTLVCAILSVAFAFLHGGINLTVLKPEAVELSQLPKALFLSFLRMLASYLVAVGFSFLVGLMAAKSLWGERLIIPILDILQSIPIVGFFPAVIAFFILMTNGHRIGIELAACFLIFTSMAWNIAFGVYESIKGIPIEQEKLVESFGVSGAKRIVDLYIPCCIPRFIYNSILSWSNGWFFLVACEIIAVGSAKYHLPGIGSFVARAAEHDKILLVIWGLAAITLLVLLLDFLIWRPASIWSNKFQQSTDSFGIEVEESSYISNLINFFSTLNEPLYRFFSFLFSPIFWIFKFIIFPIFINITDLVFSSLSKIKLPPALPWTILGCLLAVSVGTLLHWLRGPWPSMVKEIPLALLLSTGRLFVALLISLAWVVPVMLWVWNRPNLRQNLTTVAQIGASLPAIALFPLFILVFVQKLGGGMELAAILLLLTGMQWYLLFNCLGGAAIIPNDLVQITRSFGLKKTKVWAKLVLPAVRPAMVTGAITAWGGGWNALVIAEYLTFKGEVLQVVGIGALINRAVFELGDHKAIVICLSAMVGWILVLNFLIWRPLYRVSLEKFKLGG